MKTPIYRTKRMAFSAAKEYFAVRLQIKTSSVHVAIGKNSSAQCDCGQTEAYSFSMQNVGSKRRRSLEIQGGNSVTVGVCKNCGTDI